jgi:hypothetical protein
MPFNYDGWACGGLTASLEQAAITPNIVNYNAFIFENYMFKNKIVASLMTLVIVLSGILGWIFYTNKIPQISMTISSERAQPTVPPIDDSEPPLLSADQEGISQALGKGLIRSANEQDIQQFTESLERYSLTKTNFLPAIFGGSSSSKKTEQLLRNNNRYVILKNLRFPKGMGGANAVTFLLPPNVPYPRGELGHSTLLNINDGSCRGMC